MNDEQLKGVGGAMFQLANITLVATLAGPLVADPEKWPKTYGIVVVGMFGVAVWIFLYSFAVHLLGAIGSRQVE